ncbi:cryptochrome/photolyase family protein [Parahaliea maris]|uniref:Cryptochrome/photolyase family protein n=1 Tax=Parahaliea maris TaxID=2716870 RepID=A0A5C8ZNF1_9GAMM|nr:cryptochrome/photolyase family protein [Parahaliea maris]TXS89260.1 cryptochrome/photolyase family protein [Parahaliea maris]
MTDRRLILVLGDQLSFNNPALIGAAPGQDEVLLAEVHEEAGYVPHNRLKIALIFSAMRHFASELERGGYRVHYRRLDEGLPSLEEALVQTCQAHAFSRVCVCEPGEFRLRRLMDSWPERLGLPVDILEDSRFLCAHDRFRSWASGRRQLRMEHFYREMRRDYGVLLEPDGGPAGGHWNYDKENREGWRAQVAIPPRRSLRNDAVTREVLELVAEAFPGNPGDLSRFSYGVTAGQAQAEFDWFCEHALPQFGRFQDALAENEVWLFHARVSMYLNIGLLEPLALCQRVEEAWRSGHCSLAAAEGFIRQVLGWREYVRGIYWLHMPEYRRRNALAATTPLPDFFWDGDTDLRCLSQALRQTLDLGYAHHIQRLMVIGNFALLAGLDIAAVCDWYLADYVDAFEWVELPNTLGMALHADGGLMASKPYAASGKYIQRQGNHCAQCRYNPAQMTGEGACPYNALYWRFIHRHQQTFENNPRMALVLANWRKRKASEQDAILGWGERVLATLVGEGS